MRSLLSRFVDCPVLIVGDVMLDEFIWGHVARISPEAPVPVVEVRSRTQTVGGAANTAATVRSLGGRACLSGLIGHDASGTQVRDLLAALGVDVTALVQDASRPTTTKTRVVASSQQMVRIDHETIGTMDADTERRVLELLQPMLIQVRACVVSDYGKGMITASFVRKLIVLANRLQLPTIIDPKGTDYAKYAGATLVKPNVLEAGQVLNRTLRTAEDVTSAGTELMTQLGSSTAILITRGAQGMTLFQQGHAAMTIPAQAREVFDVTGAGDTVAGTLALGLAAGGDLKTACELASVAAGLVVGKIGTATCSAEELQRAVEAEH